MPTTVEKASTVEKTFTLSRVGEGRVGMNSCCRVCKNPINTKQELRLMASSKKSKSDFYHPDCYRLPMDMQPSQFVDEIIDSTRDKLLSTDEGKKYVAAEMEKEERKTLIVPVADRGKASPPKKRKYASVQKNKVISDCPDSLLVPLIQIEELLLEKQVMKNPENNGSHTRYIT